MLTLEDSLMRKGFIIKLQNMGLPIEDDLETAYAETRLKSARALIEYTHLKSFLIRPIV
jgi:hypothetical protein